MRPILLFSTVALLSSSMAEAAPVSASDGIYTDAQAARGKDAYMKECSVCHGNDLQGINESPDLNSKIFLSHWQDDRSLGDLYNFISTQMPAGSPGSLPTKAYADVLSFILQKNGFKSGATELPTDQSTLDAIKIPK